ncbi:hypothetical protein VKS41_005411 [Umbelopsis sp. WA50703]
MSSKWQKARRPPKQTQLLPKAREDLEITSSDKDSKVSRHAEGKRQPLSSVHRNAAPKPLQLKQPASRKLTQSLLKVARDASINTEIEPPKENRPVSPSYPSSFMSGNIPKKRAMPQSSQKLHDICAIRATDSTSPLSSKHISSKSRFGEEERQAVHSPTMAYYVPLSEGTSETVVQPGIGNKSTTSETETIRYSERPTNVKSVSSPGERDYSQDKSKKTKASSSNMSMRSYTSSYPAVHQKEQKKIDMPGLELKEQNLPNPKSIDKQQLQRMITMRSDVEDAGIIPITKKVHISRNSNDDEQARKAADTRIFHEPESNTLDNLATIYTRSSTTDDKIVMADCTEQLDINGISPSRSPQVLNDTTTPSTKVKAWKHASPTSRSDSEDGEKSISTTVVDSDSYTVQSTIVYSGTHSSPSSDMPTSSTDLLSPDIGYETHTMYPNPMGHNLLEKLGLLHDTQSATIPLSLDASDFDLIPAFPNPTGKRLLEKLALAAQENKLSNIAKNHSARHDETVDSTTTDDLPSSPIY